MNHSPLETPEPSTNSGDSQAEPPLATSLVETESSQVPENSIDDNMPGAQTALEHLAAIENEMPGKILDPRYKEINEALDRRLTVLNEFANWKLVGMRVLVNALTLGFVILILPNVSIPNPSLRGLLVLGAVFGLINAFVRPVLQFLIFPLLFASYGLVVVLIETLMLWLLSILLPEYLHLGSILGALGAGFLVGIIGLFLETLLGMTPPIIDPQQLTKAQRAKLRWLKTTRPKPAKDTQANVKGEPVHGS
jgi:putative membrane protein